MRDSELHKCLVWFHSLSLDQTTMSDAEGSLTRYARHFRPPSTLCWFSGFFLVANSCFKPQVLMVCRLVHSHTFTSLRFVLHSARFPNTNQTRHCFQNYTDYFKCITAKGEDFAPCKQFKRAYNSLCPSMCINVSLYVCVTNSSYLSSLSTQQDEWVCTYVSLLMLQVYIY